MTTILGIETSCDETAAAIVLDGLDIKSSTVHSQISIHQQYGGVVPELASRSHTERIFPVIDAALMQAGISKNELDAVAVTIKPGLMGSLLVGVTAAKSIAFSLGLPLIGVDHIKAHIYANVFEHDRLKFPCLGMVVSGGHTSIMVGKDPVEWEVIGQTIDDAAGEAFDKAAKILELTYPGGPAIEKAAETGDENSIAFPRTLLDKESLNFSFSGLKTAVLYTCRGKTARSARDNELIVPVNDAAASFQKTVVDIIITKIKRAWKQYQVGYFYIGGGVICNKRLRRALEEWSKESNVNVHYPSIDFCTDNAAMIAGLGYHYFKNNDFIDMDTEVL